LVMEVQNLLNLYESNFYNGTTAQVPIKPEIFTAEAQGKPCGICGEQNCSA
jgi:hypothetical protein